VGLITDQTKNLDNLLEVGHCFPAKGREAMKKKQFG
jgi:hypothetical protein